MLLLLAIGTTATAALAHDAGIAGRAARMAVDISGISAALSTPKLGLRKGKSCRLAPLKLEGFYAA